MIRTSKPQNVPGTATIEEIERYFGIKGDKRRDLFADWGLPSNAPTAWSEIWSAMGLEAKQPRKLWATLQAPLLNPKEVCQITGISVGTINDWCNKGKYPNLFPHPIRLGPRTKLWISIEILGFNEPDSYLARAQQIRRPSHFSARTAPSTKVPKIDLEPLPSPITTKKTSSPFDRSANLTNAERIARNAMFQTTEELIAEISRKKEHSASPGMATMDRVIEMLEAEIEAGQPASSRRRAQCALRSLLSTHKLTPDTVELSIANFDRLCPRTGWNPVTMPTMTQATYLDYRKRTRGSIKKTLGISQQKKDLRSRKDGWSTVVKWLMSLPRYKNRRFELSSIESTLTMCAREFGIQPVDLTQTILLTLYADASASQRRSLRNAARLIERLQAMEVAASQIWTFFPRPITAIQTTSPRHHDIPSNFQNEIEEMVEISTRVKHSKIKKDCSYLSEETRKNHRNVLRTIVNALMVVDRLHPKANTIKHALSDPDAVLEGLRYVLSRVDSGEIRASSSATMAGYLPPILERNGIYITELREDIRAVTEFKLSIDGSQMPAETQAFCRSLIERLDMRADFLLSHVPMRREAEAILRRAKNEKRGLTKPERTRVRQLGATALFCAIECGGAPIRVNNFLETTVNTPDAWLTIQSKTEFRLVVPGNKTKNKKGIDAPITASVERYHDTIRWFLEKIRPHFFREDIAQNLHEDDRQTKEAKTAALKCPWLVPGIKDPQKCLCYTTFLGWFQRLMRDLVGIACDPHNFRHGQASLLIHEYPERLDMIAKRLGDTIETVVRYYAWIHNELLMREGQKALVAMIPGRRGT